MKSIFPIAPHFDPSKSVLGLLLLSIFNDRRQADSLRIAIGIVVPLILCLLVFLFGALDTQFSFTSIPRSVLFSVQIGIAVIAYLAAFVGFAGRMEVVVENRRLDVLNRAGEILFSGSVNSAELVSRDQFHAHFSRFRSVHRVGRLRSGSPVVVLRTSSGHVAVAADKETTTALAAQFDNRSSLIAA